MGNIPDQDHASPSGDARSVSGAPRSRRKVNWHSTLGRMLGSSWFLLLGVAGLMGISQSFHSPDEGDLSSLDWANLSSKLAGSVFFVILWVLILIRPEAQIRAKGLPATLMAFLGTYLPWSMLLLPAGRPPVAAQLVAAAIMITGGVLTIYSVLHLGRSFSIVPQATHLVRNGPYKIIRHPLYAAEELSLVGAVIHFWSLWSVVVLVVHAGIQVRRMFYEERLLADAFPEYPIYAASTSRILPGVW